MSADLKPEVNPTTVPIPELIPVALLNLKMDGEVQNKLTDTKNNKVSNLACLIGGEVKTVKNKFGFELDIGDITGTDDINVNLETGRGHLSCRLYGNTPNKSGVYVYYTGVVEFGDEINKVISKQETTSDFEKCYVTNNPTFHFDDNVEEKYKWILKENVLGKGRFVRDHDGALYVQYYLYIVR